MDDFIIKPRTPLFKWYPTFFGLLASIFFIISMNGEIDNNLFFPLTPLIIIIWVTIYFKKSPVSLSLSPMDKSLKYEYSNGYGFVGTKTISLEDAIVQLSPFVSPKGNAGKKLYVTNIAKKGKIKIVVFDQDRNSFTVDQIDEMFYRIMKVRNDK